MGNIKFKTQKIFYFLFIQYIFFINFLFIIFFALVQIIFTYNLLFVSYKSPFGYVEQLKGEQKNNEMIYVCNFKLKLIRMLNLYM